MYKPSKEYCQIFLPLNPIHFVVVVVFFFTVLLFSWISFYAVLRSGRKFHGNITHCSFSLSLLQFMQSYLSRIQEHFHHSFTPSLSLYSFPEYSFIFPFTLISSNTFHIFVSHSLYCTHNIYKYYVFSTKDYIRSLSRINILLNASFIIRTTKVDHLSLDEL